MKKYIVTTPNPSFAGNRLGVEFYNGKAETELTVEQVNQFDAWGYVVEEVKAPTKKAPTKK